MQYGNGPIIDRASVVSIFRGSGWNGGNPPSADVRQVFSAILASPYASELVQYRGVRRPSLVDTMTDTSDIGHLGPDPRGFLTSQVLLIDTSEVIQTVKNARRTGQHEPIGSDALYIVIISLDPFPVFSEPRYNNAGGFHDQFQDDDGKTVRYGVVLNWSANSLANIWNSQMCLPALLTHEMAEACTDPDLTTGFRLDDGEEVGDINDVRPVQLPGVAQTVGLAAYWSDLRSTGIVPTYYSARVTFGLRPRDTLGSLRNLVAGTSLIAAMRARLEP